MRTRKFWPCGFYWHSTCCNFLPAMELLLCSSLFFLDKLLMRSLLRYLQWAFLTFCAHAEFSYLYNYKTCLERSAVSRTISLSSKFLLSFATVNFCSVLIFALATHLQNLDVWVVLVIQRLCSTTKIFLHKYFRKYGIPKMLSVLTQTFLCLLTELLCGCGMYSQVTPQLVNLSVTGCYKLARN